jgi:hypothetical protein
MSQRNWTRLLPRTRSSPPECATCGPLATSPRTDDDGSSVHSGTAPWPTPSPMRSAPNSQPRIAKSSPFPATEAYLC